MRTIIKNRQGKLKKCPFCNGKAEIVQEETWLHKTYRIRCSKCKITTQRQWSNTGIHTNKGFKVLTPNDCINIAKLQWNNRTNNERTNNERTK